MLKINKRSGSLVILAIAILLLISSPAAAAVSGFVVEDNNGNLYKYNYGELLDSYALSIIGPVDDLYQSFAVKKTYAILSSSGKYIDYNNVLDRYAAALVNGETFNLTQYVETDQAKTAIMPETIKEVRLNSGKIVYETIKINSGETGTDPGHQTRKTKTAITGSAEASVEQARKWAENRDAHPRFINIASLYWEHGKKTGLRPEVLYAQSAMETNFGHFDGAVPPEYNNWAGLKIVEDDGDSRKNHEIFDTPEEGVRAHFNHLSAYTGLEPIGEPHERYHLVKRQSWAGTVFFVEDLSGIWTPSGDYHVYILIALDQLLDTEVEIRESETDGNNNHNEENSDTDSNPGPGGDNPGEKYVAVDVSVLRLRAAPSTDDAILDRLILGTVLEVLDNQGVWLRVITPEGKKGWVHGDYVREIDINVSGSPLKGRVIVVDPGHGGSDPGATGITGLREKVVNLAVAKELIPMLEAAGATVITTRTGDQTVSNQARVGLANNSGADVFISIHANSSANYDSNGTETYYCSKNANGSASRFLAHQLQREVVSVLGLRNRGAKATSFFVLTNTNIPAALIELGFLSNFDEEELLGRPETHRKAAEALYKGLEAYFLYYQ